MVSAPVAADVGPNVTGSPETLGIRWWFGRVKPKQMRMSRTFPRPRIVARENKYPDQTLHVIGAESPSAITWRGPEKYGQSLLGLTQRITNTF